jgi:thiol-disulfide isomerase/thioredoxin
MKTVIVDRSAIFASRPRGLVRIAIFSFLAAGTIAAWFLREPLRNLVFAEGVMANDGPTQEAIEQVIDLSADQQDAIRRAWDTGRIVHREVAIRRLSRLIPADAPLPTQFESWVLAAARDPDASVRETALGIVHGHNSPALAAICMAQLKDCDPQVRLLGLDHLNGVSSFTAIPIIVPLLDDPDPLIVVRGLKLLERWTGQKFGVMLAETAPVENEMTGLEEFPEGSQTKAKAGATRAKAWWASHQSEFGPVEFEAPAAVFDVPPSLLPAGDFHLSGLDGRQIRLSDFRGKVVLLNFWTTWCPACLSEIPELIALQKRYGEHIAIIGVSLDNVPDEDGHLGGNEGAESSSGDHPSLNTVREKVARTVKARGITYTVLLDKNNSVGSRFNGGELPTTVIVDAQGYVRRRFIGARSLPVFEAMIAEASQPLPSNQNKLAFENSSSSQIRNK